MLCFNAGASILGEQESTLQLERVASQQPDDNTSGPYDSAPTPAVLPKVVSFKETAPVKSTPSSQASPRKTVSFKEDVAPVNDDLRSSDSQKEDEAPAAKDPYLEMMAGPTQAQAEAPNFTDGASSETQQETQKADAAEARDVARPFAASLAASRKLMSRNSRVSFKEPAREEAALPVSEAADSQPPPEGLDAVPE